MAVFSYLYFNSYVAREVGITVGGVLSAAMQLNRRAELPLSCMGLPCALVSMRTSTHLPGRQWAKCRRHMSVTAPLSFGRLSMGNIYAGMTCCM